jgi:hypothetical protein
MLLGTHCNTTVTPLIDTVTPLIDTVTPLIDTVTPLIDTVIQSDSVKPLKTPFHGEKKKSAKKSQNHKKKLNTVL